MLSTLKLSRSSGFETSQVTYSHLLKRSKTKQNPKNKRKQNTKTGFFKVDFPFMYKNILLIQWFCLSTGVTKTLIPAMFENVSDLMKKQPQPFVIQDPGCETVTYHPQHANKIIWFFFILVLIFVKQQIENNFKNIKLLYKCTIQLVLCAVGLFF